MRSEIDRLLHDKNIAHTSKLAHLENTRIGIDVFHWLKHHIEIKEPYNTAIGSTPLTFISTIQKEIEKFKKFKIKPVFVFAGLNGLWKDQRPKLIFNEKDKKRRTAWNCYECGQTEGALSLFLATSLQPIDFVHVLLKYFIDNDIEYFRAPYAAWPQLARFEHKDKPLVHAIYGPEDMLMFDVSRVIFSIDFTDGTFEYADKSELLANLQVTADQFVDFCILAGNIINRAPADLSMNYHAILENVKSYKSGYVFIASYVMDPNVLEQFMKTKHLIEHNIYLDLNGQCKITNEKTCPADIVEIHGPKLTNEIYALLSQGIISHQVLSNLISGYVHEAGPLVDSEEFRSSINYLAPLRAAAINVTASVLHESFHKKQVTFYRWFDSNEKVEFQRKLFKWNEQGIALTLSQDEIGKNDMDLATLTALKLTNGKDQQVTSTVDETVAQVLFKTLELMGYLEMKNKGVVDWNGHGKALKLAKFNAEQALLLLELCRYEVISNEPLTPTYKRVVFSQANAKPIENESDIRLIARCVSVLSAQLNDNAWNGPVDQDLAGFNSIVKACCKCYHNLMDSILMNIVLNRKTTLGAKDLLAVSSKLPFFQEPNTAIGLLMKHVLSVPLDQMQAKLAALSTTFSNCVNPIADLQKAVKFWDQFIIVLQTLGKNALPSFAAFLAQFLEADKFLATRKHVIMGFSPAK